MIINHRIGDINEGKEEAMLGRTEPPDLIVVHCIDLVAARQHEHRDCPLDMFGAVEVVLSEGITPEQVVSCIEHTWPAGTPVGDLLKVYRRDRHVYVTLGSDEWAKAQLLLALSKHGI